MKYILIQIALNIIILRFLSEKVTEVYKKLAYILYPVLITALIVFTKQKVVLNEHYGFALDVTILYSRYYILTLALIIGIQFLFNNFLFKIFNRRIEKSS